MSIGIFTIVSIIVLASFIRHIVKEMSVKGMSNGQKLLGFTGSACVLYGAFAFFSSFILSAGDFKLQNNQEWPIGVAHNVLVYSDGTHIVPHEPSARVQIYDANLRFLRGWHINTYGGVMKLIPGDENYFEVYTARGNERLRFDLLGNLISSENYEKGLYSKLPSVGHTLKIPTPIYLLVFAHRFAAWALIVAGSILLWGAKRKGESQ